MVFDKMRWLYPLLLLFLLAGCGGMTDDLNPSGSDKRPPTLPGTTGPAVGQTAPDFTLPDTLGNSVTLTSELTTTNTQGVVLFFTMWCPLCDADMTDIKNLFIPVYPNVQFIAIDYVSGSPTDAAINEQNNGFTGSGFIVLADTPQQYVMNLYVATMETTVVIDKNGIVRMNEGYKNARLQAILSSLP